MILKTGVFFKITYLFFKMKILYFTDDLRIGLKKLYYVMSKLETNLA